MGLSRGSIHSLVGLSPWSLSIVSVVGLCRRSLSWASLVGLSLGPLSWASLVGLSRGSLSWVYRVGLSLGSIAWVSRVGLSRGSLSLDSLAGASLFLSFKSSRNAKLKKTIFKQFYFISFTNNCFGRDYNKTKQNCCQAVSSSLKSVARNSASRNPRRKARKFGRRGQESHKCVQ